MSCVFIVLKYVLEVVACTAPRFWHRKCRYPQIREFMPIPQVPQFPVYRFICIFIGPKYILTYHPHTFDPQGLSQPRIYTSNSPCPRSGRAVRGSQQQQSEISIMGAGSLICAFWRFECKENAQYRRTGQATRKTSRSIT